jgi:hypothetical protein
MSKTKINKTRLFFALLIGAALYLALMNYLLKTGSWHFDMLKRTHWDYVIRKWQNGWVIKEKKDVLFFTVMLSFFPGWIIMTFAVYGFSLKNFLLFPVRLLQKRKQRALMKKSLDLANGKKPMQTGAAAHAPAAQKKLPAKSNPTLDKLRGRQTPASAQASSSPPASSSASSFAPASSSGPKKSYEQLQLEHLQRWDVVASDLEENDVFCFRSTKIGEFAVKLTVLTQDAVFWFIEGPLQAREWTMADDDPIKGVWISGDESIPSPLKQTFDAKNVFLKHLAENSFYQDVTLHAFVVMDAGSVKNPEKLTKDLSDWDVGLLKMPPCDDDDLTDLSTVIKYIKGLPASDMAFNDSVAESIMALEKD